MQGGGLKLARGDGMQELFEKLLKVKVDDGRRAGPPPRDALGIADLYFVEELWRTKSKKEAMQWLRARQWQVNSANLDSGCGSGGRSSGRSSGMSSGCPSALSSPRTRALEAAKADAASAATTSTAVHAPGSQGVRRSMMRISSRNSIENRGLLYTDAAHLVLSRDSSPDSCDDAPILTTKN